MRTLAVIFVFLSMLSVPALAQDYDLSAPDTTYIRQSIEVQWTAPQPDGGLIEIRRADGSRGRTSYAYVRDNPVAVEAPEAPGDYVIVYIFEREVQASRPLGVVMAEASLIAPAQADAGAPVVIEWDGPKSRNDHVTFAESGGNPMRGSSYSYVGNSKDGTVKLTAPADSGNYDVVYITGETILARAPMTVGSVSATLEAPAEVHAGGLVDVKWDGPNNSQDHVTFATRDGEPIRGASYMYVSNTSGGIATLTASEETGSYDIVYIASGRIIGRTPVEVVAVSMSIAGPAEVETHRRFPVEWSGNASHGDRIVIAPPGDVKGFDYQHIDPLVGSVSLSSPDEPGSYELVYLTRSMRELARAPLNVVPGAVEPGELEVLGASGAGLTPDDAVEIILDASGSMLQRQDGERRIDIAKRTLTTLVEEVIPSGTGFAMRVFGNREADACRTDLEIALAPLDAGAAKAVVSGLEAINLARTPIADSVALAQSDLAGVGGTRLLVVVTDGEETCDGDPAAAIAQLRKLGWDIRVNIVGYAIDDLALADTFRSWAAIGGGEYFEAGDAEELATALTGAVATPFRLLDADGAVAASGLVGDPALTVPAGDYTLHSGSSEVAVTIEPGKRASVEL